MPYDKRSQSRIKKLHGVPLSLAQLNSLAKMADAIGGDFGWPTAIKKFQEGHHIEKGKWIVNKKKADAKEEVIVQKEADGRWGITTISTAAVRDLEDETFGTEAMDYEIKQAQATGVYPEFRVFHKKALAIGKVTRMSRVGQFMVDHGYAYDDPFSQQVCKNMLAENKEGKWRTSRGFYVLEAKGRCPGCKSLLGLKSQHMIAGFKCPVCEKSYTGYKKVLSDVHFLKTKTFDITVTDRPCNPYTGAMANKEYLNPEGTEMAMTKKELKAKLLEAGLEEKAIDERLALITDEALKEYDVLPFAQVLKEFGGADGQEQEAEDDGTTFVLDASVLKEFAQIVKDTVTPIVQAEVAKAVKEALVDLEIELPDNMGFTSKELPELGELVTKVDGIQTALDKLFKTDEERLKERLAGASRNGLRVLRMKAKKPKMPMEGSSEEEAGESDEEEATEDNKDTEDVDDIEAGEIFPTTPRKNPGSKFKQIHAGGKITKVPSQAVHDGLIMDGGGNVHPSMTEFIQGTVRK
jgi:hypothetical protein